MFTYDPMTEEQAMKERYQLLEDGVYSALVVKAEARPSSKGNPMIVLDLSVYDKNGKPHDVQDYLVFTNQMMWKTIHCADSAGLAKEYDEKKFCPEIIEGKNVMVKIITKIGNPIPPDKLNGKPPGSCYPNKNAVEDYIKKADQPASVAPAPAADFPDDDIPF